MAFQGSSTRSLGGLEELILREVQLRHRLKALDDQEAQRLQAIAARAYHLEVLGEKIPSSVMSSRQAEDELQIPEFLRRH